MEKEDLVKALYDGIDAQNSAWFWSGDHGKNHNYVEVDGQLHLDQLADFIIKAGK